jgi:hypothetical protein
VTHVGKYWERHKFVPVSQREVECEEHPDEVLDLATDDMVFLLLHIHNGMSIFICIIVCLILFKEQSGGVSHFNIHAYI